jgi:hypothetical protein
MCFSLCQEANFWDESGAQLVRDGHVVTWRKMTSINSRAFMENTRQKIFLVEKSYRQRLLN